MIYYREHAGFQWDNASIINGVLDFQRILLDTKHQALESAQQDLKIVL